MTPEHSILHIIADDLRPELGAYGLRRHTPNIDKLASQGVSFDRAYAQQAVCGPSRNSFMSGRRPDASRSWNFINHFREDHPEWTTLPGLFKDAGRLAVGVGKVYHPQLPPGYDGARSWSGAALPYHNPCWNTADNTSTPATGELKDGDGGLPCVPCPIDVRHYAFHDKNVTVANEWCEVDAFEDTLTIQLALAHLRRLAAGGRSFYLAVGLHKPHMPWQAAPEDFAAVDALLGPGGPPLARRQTPPDGAPGLAMHLTEEQLHADPYHPIGADGARAARRAYYAACAGMDRKLGALLDELEAQRLSETTAVVLHSDHGWHLGELGGWRKFTNFEAATRVPLIVRAPWLARRRGSVHATRVAEVVELVDVLPTVAALAGLPLPAGESFDGRSLLPLLGGPDDGDVEERAAPPPPPPAAFSQYPRRVHDAAAPWDNGIIHEPRASFTHMGFTVRVAEWRYTEWRRWNGSALRAVWCDGAPGIEGGRGDADNVSAELYDHRACNATYPTDFDSPCEDANVAGRAEHAAVVRELSARLRRQFDAPATEGSCGMGVEGCGLAKRGCGWAFKV